MVINEYKAEVELLHVYRD